MEPFNFDLEALKKQQEEAENQKQMIGMIGGVADSMANVPTAWEIMKGRDGKRIDIAGQAKAAQDAITDPMERQKKLYEQYKLAKSSQEDTELSDANSEKSKRAQQFVSSRFPALGKSVAGMSAAEIYKNAPFIEKAISGEYGLEEKNIQAKADIQKANAKVPKGFAKQIDPETGVETLVPTLKTLPPDKILLLNDSAQIPNVLSDLTNTIKDNSDLFGPIQGQVFGANKWHDRAQTVQAQIASAKQSIGKLREGGVLRKEDEEKYTKMLSSLPDNPEVALAKIQMISRELAMKHVDSIKALKMAGYDVSPFEKNMAIPEMPSILRAKRKQGGGGGDPLLPSANAAQSPAVGDVQKGYRFKGGDPADPGSWESVIGPSGYMTRGR